MEPNTYDRQLTQIRQAYLQAYPLPVGNRHLIPTPIMILLRKKAEPRRSHERERERERELEYRNAISKIQTPLSPCTTS